jgi:hypothetical protein
MSNKKNQRGAVSKQRLMQLIISGAVLCLVTALANAAVQSGVYQTLPGATVVEQGDRVPGGSRTVPLTATVTLNLGATPPSLTAVITNAVWEGRAPAPLTVHSFSGTQLTNGTFRFSGDYLRDVYPAGTEYLFDWEFSAGTNGDVLWNGMAYCACGHIWFVAYSNLTAVLQPQLAITRAGTDSVQLSWATNFTDYALEYVTALPSAGWSLETNAVSNTGDRLSIMVHSDALQRFYRLHKP